MKIVDRYVHRDDLVAIFWIPMAMAVGLVFTVSWITIALMKVAGALAC